MPDRDGVVAGSPRATGPRLLDHGAPRASRGALAPILRLRDVAGVPTDLRALSRLPGRLVLGRRALALRGRARLAADPHDAAPAAVLRLATNAAPAAGVDSRRPGHRGRRRPVHRTPRRSVSCSRRAAW